MAEISKSASMSHEALYDLLVGIKNDLAAIKTAVDSNAAVIAENKAAINAVITAADTDIAAVAAVTPVSGSTTDVGTLETTVEGE